MNIDIINNQVANRKVGIDKNQYGNPAATDSRMKTSGMGYSLDITGKVTENAAYGREELKSAQDIAQAAGNQDVTLQRNYAAVMSNSMSAEDFAQLTKDGVDPTNTDISESVTNLDKIKIRMAEAGITIAGFNDDLSAEQISEVVGSLGLANTISNALSIGDIPATEDNVAEAMKAISLSESLQPLSDEAMKYMLVNNLEPTIENLYKAEYSSGVDYFENSSAKEGVWDELKSQAEEIVEKSHVIREDGLAAAEWIVKHDVMLTPDTIDRYDELSKLELPLKAEDALKSITAALGDGLEAVQANVTSTESLYEKAVRLVDDYAKIDSGQDITKRRMLEEVRLAMTAEANLVLLRKGIHVDTQPLETLVEQLKEAEKEFYRPVLLEGEAAQDNRSLTEEESYELSDRIELYKAARSVMNDIAGIPVRAMAEVAFDDSSNPQEFSLSDLHTEGEALKASYIKANESYEALMTAPRADMGDSIRKAFGNVDDILEDIGMDINDSTRKAVRTLGYAQMEINKESVDNVIKATNAVKAVMSLMTPAKTLQMIRQGHNPLSENIYELKDALSEETIYEDTEKYSRFLWKLEKSGQITEDEKSAYIGMYRLFHQIEKQDGRVIGDVLANGMELTMQNMLTASRSNRHKNVDVQIDDDFGVLEDIVSHSESISEQISRGFVQMMSEPVPKDYAQEKLEDIKRAVKESHEIENLLMSVDEPVTVANVLAASDIMTPSGRQYRKLFGNDSHSDSDDENNILVSEDMTLSDVDADNILNDFSDRGSAERAFDEFAQKALEIASRHLESSESYADIKEWTDVYRKLDLGRAFVRRQMYDIPVPTKDGYTSIHLTINGNGSESGKVTASFETEELGRVNARFTLKQNGVDGFIVSDSRAGVDALKKKEDAFVQALEEQNMQAGSLSIVYGRNAQPEALAEAEEAEASNRELYSIAKAFIVAMTERV